MRCKTCGDDMSGDGYKIPLHCINVSEEVWWCEAPDSGPYFCDEGEEEE
jgi:hypothetical protein